MIDIKEIIHIMVFGAVWILIVAMIIFLAFIFCTIVGIVVVFASFYTKLINFVK